MLIKFCPYTSVGCRCSWFILFKRQPFFNQVYTLYFHYTPPYLISVWVKYQFSVLNTIYPCSCTLCIFVFDAHFFHHTEEYYHCLKEYLTCLKKVNWNILNAHQLPGTSGDIVTDSIPANSHALGVSLTPAGWKLRSHAHSRLRTNFSRLIEKCELLPSCLTQFPKIC